MDDFFSLPEVIPLGAIFFSFLFLLVSIPIEAYVLNVSLNFDKKTSSFYSMCMNLLSNVIGWSIFFLMEPFISARLKSSLINLIFFNRILPNMLNLSILMAFIIFFGTFIMKSFILRAAIVSLSDFWKKIPQSSPKRFYARRSFRMKLQSKNIFTTVLIANSLSYTAVILILFTIIRIG
ncbi:filament integrity protein FraC [Fischerella sp. PCC 9605]|uniref:filament integrity protein FraC n=1 Tax=Fischerella sp. PCC 9605 TaxID=1173024 RepID=UPI0004B939FF|nr:filament integrity protein FraC [Fischerella sp. PCC 9605]